MPSGNRFIDIINDSLTSEKLIDFLNKNYPDALPVWEYNCIYTLCSGKDRKKRRKLVYTLFEYYNHNPIIIKEDLIQMIIMHLHDFELIKYLSELCIHTNYAPIRFTQKILNTVCAHNQLDMLKYIIDLPNISHKYDDVMKNINIIELFSADLSDLIEREMILFLIKYSKNNKYLHKSYKYYDYHDETEYTIYSNVSDKFHKIYMSIGIMPDSTCPHIFI